MPSTVARLLLRTAVTSLATTTAVAVFSKRETGHAAAGLNATSHILRGDEALRQNAADLRHTPVGGALNAAAMLSWAIVGQLLPAPRGVWGALRNGVLVSTMAYFTDFHVVPKRLTPGFEHRLSKPSLLRTYVVFAASYALGAALGAKRAAVT